MLGGRSQRSLPHAGRSTARPATPRHIHNWLARIGRETGLRFDATSGWNRYSTPSWAIFHQLAAAALNALSDRPGDPPGRPGCARGYDRADRALSDRCDDLPGRPGRGPAYDLDRHRIADDRAVEALLASVSEPCTAQQLACGLGWTLNRTVGALRRPEASLANTGQILTRLGHHSYALGPRPRLVDDRQIARCLRHNHKALDVTAAAVLHRRSPARAKSAPVKLSATPRSARRLNG